MATRATTFTLVVYEPEETQQHFEEKSKVYERFLKIKQSKFLKRLKGTEKSKSNDRTINRKLKMVLFNLLH